MVTGTIKLTSLEWVEMDMLDIINEVYSIIRSNSSATRSIEEQGFNEWPGNNLLLSSLVDLCSLVARFTRK